MCCGPVAVKVSTSSVVVSKFGGEQAEGKVQSEDKKEKGKGKRKK